MNYRSFSWQYTGLYKCHRKYEFEINKVGIKVLKYTKSAFFAKMYKNFKMYNDGKQNSGC